MQDFVLKKKKKKVKYFNSSRFNSPQKSYEKREGAGKIQYTFFKKDLGGKNQLRRSYETSHGTQLVS